MIKLLLLSIAAVGLSSCASITGSKPVDRPKFPSMNAKTVNVKKGFDIREGFDPPIGTFNGKTWDLKGGTLTLIGKPCNNNEKGEKIVVWLDGLTIKNGGMSKFQDGLNIRAKNVTVDGIVFNSCEDAVNSGEGSENFTLKNCYFKPHDKKESSEVHRGDKAAQMAITKGNNLIENNVFWNYINGIRVGLKKYDNSNQIGTTTIRKNEFIWVATAVQRTVGKTKISDNKYVSVEQEYKESE